MVVPAVLFCCVNRRCAPAAAFLPSVSAAYCAPFATGRFLILWLCLFVSVWTDIILHSRFRGISCAMLRFVLSSFLGLVMHAASSVRNFVPGLCDGSEFSPRSSCGIACRLFRSLCVRSCWNVECYSCDCWAYWRVFWFRHLRRVDFDTRRLLFLCCVYNIIFDDWVVILGFICAIYCIVFGRNVFHSFYDLVIKNLVDYFFDHYLFQIVFICFIFVFRFVPYIKLMVWVSLVLLNFV